MHPHLKLLALNKGRGQFKAESGGDEATIYLYDAIVDTPEDAEWFGGVAPRTFIDQLKAIDAPVIHLRINSPGGSVFAARAMEQAMREHPSRIVAHIDGYAASAASFLMMAADEIQIAQGAMVMIHKAWTIAYGNSDDLVSTADLLDKIDASLVQTYAARTGLEAQAISEMMAAETWLSADEAVEKGFADSVAESKAKAMWDFSAYKNAPAAASLPDEPKSMDMPCKFQVGDRVVVLNPHSDAHAAGEVVICSGEPVYGVLIDGETVVHKWYVESELDADGDDMNASRKKKHDPGKPGHEQNEFDASALMRRLEVASRI